MKKISLGRLISAIGVLELGISLLLFSFDVVSKPIFRVAVSIGVAIQIAALVISLKRNEF